MTYPLNLILILFTTFLIGTDLYCQNPTAMTVQPANNSGNGYIEVSSVSNTLTLVITSYTNNTVTLTQNCLIPIFRGSLKKISERITLKGYEKIYIDLNKVLGYEFKGPYVLKLGKYKYKLTTY